jgi:hypothetical protein
MLIERGLGAYHPKILLLISDKNKHKRLEFCNLTRRWTGGAFFSEMKVGYAQKLFTCASFDISPRRNFLKNIPLNGQSSKGGKKFLVWAAIFFDELEQLYFIEDK